MVSKALRENQLGTYASNCRNEAYILFLEIFICFQPITSAQNTKSFVAWSQVTSLRNIESSVSSEYRDTKIPLDIAKQGGATSPLVAFHQ